MSTIILRPVRPADDELPGRVDVPVAVLGDRQVAQRLADVGLDHLAHLLRIPARLEMLRRQHDLRHLGRLAVGVAHRHLALGVGPQPGGLALALVAGGSQELQDLVAVVDRRRHQVGCLAAGIAEHDALVARAFLALPVRRVVDALRDVGRLAVQEHVDACLLPMEAVLLVADGADRLARRRLELRRVDDGELLGVLQDVAVLVLLEQRLRHPYLAGDHHAVGGGQRLAGAAHVPGVHARLLRLPVDQIDDLVGDAVADLVGMAFGNGFAGEEVVRARHGCPLKKGAKRRDAVSRARLLAEPVTMRQAQLKFLWLTITLSLRGQLNFALGIFPVLTWRDSRGFYAKPLDLRTVRERTIAGNFSRMRQRKLTGWRLR